MRLVAQRFPFQHGGPMRFRQRPTAVLSCVFLATACGPAREPLLLAAEELTTGAAESILPNSAFLPSDSAGAAHAPFEGTLVFQAAEMATDPSQVEPRTVLGRDTQLFPGAALGFFTHEDHIVPVDRSLIRVGSRQRGGSYWDILVFPGRIWSEPADGAWSRASFGFALGNHMEGESHNGVATFLYDGTEVSGLRYQILTETSPFYVEGFFEAWGQLEMAYEPGPVPDRDALATDYAAELEQRLPVAAWDELGAGVGPEQLEGSERPLDPAVIALAVVRDGVLYRAPCFTPYGDLPYCDEQRFGVWSVTKTAVAAVGMLALAQKYSPEVFDLPVLEYVAAQPPHDGWDGVTIGDALNMATGLGEGSEVTEPNNSGDGYLVRYEWYDEESAGEKVVAVLDATEHPWGPGEVFRYRDQDMFLVGVVAEAYLKEVEGPDASFWRFLLDEVYRPIGIPVPAISLTNEPDGHVGVPTVQQGFYATLDELARLAMLLQNGGEHDGRQILHRAKLAELMYETPVRGLGDGRPTEAGMRTYHMATWHWPFTVAEGCTVDLPYMSGWGGQRVMMFPNGMTTIRIARLGVGEQTLADPTVPAAFVHALRPLCQ